MYARASAGPICLVNTGTTSMPCLITPNTAICAKCDYSGYSNFTSDCAEHQKNAKEYQQNALDKKGSNVSMNIFTEKTQ